MDETTKTEPRVSGKQVLLDAAILFKDLGIFMYDVGKIAVTKLKTAFKTNEKERRESGDEISTVLDKTVVAQAS